MKIEDEIYKTIEENKFNNINGLMLTNKEISIIDKYNINYKKCNSLKDLLFKIETVIENAGNCEDLDIISETIAERDYYQNTNK